MVTCLPYDVTVNASCVVIIGMTVRKHLGESQGGRGWHPGSSASESPATLSRHHFKQVVIDAVGVLRFIQSSLTSIQEHIPLLERLEFTYSKQLCPSHSQIHPTQRVSASLNWNHPRKSGRSQIQDLWINS